jgi:hypothetical protein
MMQPDLPEQDDIQPEHLDSPEQQDPLEPNPAHDAPLQPPLAQQPAEIPSSRYIVRSIDGLRMALAGFPAYQPVSLGEGCEIEAHTIADLRALDTVPHALEVLVPYRLLPESVVSVNLLSPEWQTTER